MKGDPDLAAGRGRTLVFAADVKAARRAAILLKEAGISCLQYHKQIPAAERTAALDSMRRWGLRSHLMCDDFDAECKFAQAGDDCTEGGSTHLC